MTRPLPFLILLSLATLVLNQVEGVLPLRDQWAAACRALSRGQAGQAAALLEEFEAWYGAEPAVLEPEFRDPYLRLRGLTLLQTGDTAGGISLLEEWLENSGEAGPYSAFIRFQLAQAYLASGDQTAAEAHWERFLTDHPGLPECALVHWMWADQLVRQEKFAEAREHLENVLRESRLPGSGTALARAALALVDLRLGNLLSGLEQLRAEAAESPVLLAWRAILAPALAHQLLEAGNYEEARQASSWFDRPENLVHQLATLRQPDRRQSGIREGIWNRHWSGQLRRLQSTAGNSPGNLPDMAQLYHLRMEILMKSDRSHVVL